MPPSNDSPEMAAVVVGLLEHEGRILIGRKRQVADHFFDGAWHVPSGHIAPGESPQMALVRELKEETNLDVDVHELLAEYALPELGYYVRWFRVTAKSLDIKPGDDLVEVAFVSRAEALNRFPDKVIPTWPQVIAEYFGVG